ncbi:MAG: DinB family protein [Acidobacteria bacterium]|nr:DinB family protein [Acidobacteriota bacterium]
MITTAPPWVNRVISEFDAAGRRARDAAAGLSAAQINWKPAPGSWSIGQCLAHLIVANDVYLPAIGSALEGQPRGRAEEITPGWFGRLFIRRVIEASPNTRKGKAPNKIEPPGEQFDASILDRFLRSNESARDFVRRAADYDVNRIRFKNPFVSWIRFTAGTGIEIIWKHQVRHLLQAERVKQAPGFPAR